MSDLPADPAGPSERSLERRARLELTPAERVVRRRNRRLILLIAVPALVVGAAALIATLLASSSSPSVPPRFVPAGYKAVTDGFFGYAVPANWATNDLYTDNVGDLYTSGPDGWVGEHIQGRTDPPVAGEAAPAAFKSFGVGRPSPYQLGPAQPLSVPGAQAAFRYAFTRPGGAPGVAVEAWRAKPGAEIWMLVAAPDGVTARILSTLNA